MAFWQRREIDELSVKNNFLNEWLSLLFPSPSELMFFLGFNS